ncbi:metallophosphoesterase [Bradyrhizobium pachyrhizi]|uniref:Metallophosphoesterase n=1 Tax=Bradyrhizobium pachyrhizi TaxID=280333 RepID=A0A844SH34_9BRAD|nr:metallophosphoesterase [Bradyrhizobium pachyrhizi]MVT64845.1 metallophosphoesterase [Bradyrhizobium pachyrhizi]
MMLWVLSDLHLELTRGWDLPSPNERPCFDVLVVAGDLIPKMDRGVRWLRERVADRPVIYIPGNHEAYGTDIDRTVEKARQAAVNTNVRILQDDAEMIGDVLFVGATLWTDFELFGSRFHAMKAAADVMNDYRKIRTNSYGQRLRPADTVARHFTSREFISHTIRSTPARCKVVISHHGCVRAAIRTGMEHDIISAAYVSDCAKLLDGVDLWIYGHTHESRDFMIGSTRIVSNAKGYGPWMPSRLTWDNQHFDPYYVIQV